MYWLIFPLMGLHIIIICGIVALRERWAWATFAILVFSLSSWAYLLNVLLADVTMGRH